MVDKSIEYWEESWLNEDMNELKGYLKGYFRRDHDLIKILREHKLVKVCDAACGFGAYSLLLASNGMDVSGFDIANSSIDITKQLLGDYGVDTSNFIVSSITDIKFEDECFDATIAHAVLDHLIMKDAKIALKELIRITKKSGLIYISFDGFQKDDEEEAHDMLADGSFVYLEGSRKGMIFKYYRDEEILELCSDRKIIYQVTRNNGERVIILQKDN